MSVIGLDLGAKGAFVERRNNGQIICVRWSKVSPGEVLSWLKVLRNVFGDCKRAYVEQLGARAGDSGKHDRIGKMLHTAGGQEMLLTLAGFEIEYVAPTTWQPEFGLAGLSHLTNSQKQTVYVATVLDLYGIKVTREEGSAVLIATYGWRKENGELTNGRTTKGTRLQREGTTGRILWESRQKT